jgi:hypothetical protein
LRARRSTAAFAASTAAFAASTAAFAASTAVFAASMILAAAACGGQETGKPELCAVGQSSSAVKAADRKIVGAAAPYEADATIAAREAELHASQRARRELGWKIFAKVLEPVELGEPSLGTVPTWRTWYAKDDFERMFHRLYEALGPEGRAARSDFARKELDDIFAWNARSVEELPDWPDERYQEYLAGFDDELDAHGAAGNARIGYSPDVLMHYFEDYPKVLDCMAGGVPPAFVEDGVEPGESIAITEVGVVAACDTIDYGPYALADGETLTARLTGPEGADADLFVRVGGPADEVDYDCKSRGESSDEQCDVTGPGLVYVAVAGFAPSSEFTLSVEYVGSEASQFASCFRDELPADAALVKADWRRAQFGDPLPVYDTSAARLTQRMNGAGDWGDGDGLADPGPDVIYTVRLPSDGEYRMAAMHIMTKELRHWVWITLWWSDDPDTDFGADRPQFIRDLGGPWSSYKMCVVTSFDEGDADPTGGYAQSAPTLAEALAAIHRGEGGPSWCSNPYLEEGPANARTNCIGCHQHAGTDAAVEAIIDDDGAFAHNGRTRDRNNFPADYLWSFNQGDRLATAIEATVQHWDSVDP